MTAISVRQIKGTSSDPGSDPSTVTPDSAFLAGSTLVAFGTTGSPGSEDFVSCSDGTNGTYSALSNVNDVSNTQRLGSFAKAGIAASTPTVSLDLTSAAGGFTGLVVLEVTGAKLALPAGGSWFTAQKQATPTTGSGACTSGNATPETGQIAYLIVGCSENDFDGSPPAAVDGTWTDHGTFFSGGGARVVSKRVLASSPQAALWTATSNVSHLNAVVILSEAPSGTNILGPGPTVPGEFNRRIPPFWPPSEIPRSTARANQTFTQSLSATATASASIKRQVGKSVSAAASAAAAKVARVGKACAATATGTAVQVKQIGKLVALTATASPTLLAQKTFTKALTASATATASLRRQVGKSVSASATATAARAVQVGKACAAAATGAAAVAKQVGKRVAGTASAAGSLLAQRAIGVALNASASASASVRRQVGKGVAATSSSAASISRAVATRISAASSAAASVTKRIGKALSAAAAGSAATGTSVHSGGSGSIVSQSLSAVATATARLVLGIFPKVFKQAPTTHRPNPVDVSSNARRAKPVDLREK